VYHVVIGWQERYEKDKNEECAINIFDILRKNTGELILKDTISRDIS
jgi:hypothetical protein